MDFEYEREDRTHLRPGAEHLRQAIVCLPLGLLALFAGMAFVEGASESLGNAMLLLGIVLTGIGAVRLLQGLWHRVG